MKTQIALFAGNANPYQFEKAFAGRSAFERSLDWALAFPQAAETGDFESPLILTDSQTDASARAQLAGRGNPEVLCRPSWSIADMTAALASRCKERGVQTLLFCLGASPFLNSELAKTVLAHHLRYVCEYTFADGYAQGLAPAAIDAGALEILAGLAEKDFANKPVTAEALFAVIKGDINSFEVETVISPEDLRLHRFDFSCLSKRTLEVCKNLYAAAPKTGGINALDAVAIGRLAAETENVRRTIPSFYNVQVSCWDPFDTLYSPYPAAYAEKFGHHPAVSREKNPRWHMDARRFKALAQEMAALSGEAVVSLSAWGEPLSHPEFAELVFAAMAEPGLSLLVETNGALVTQVLAETIAGIVKRAGKRTNGHEPVYWIVSLDAVDEEAYRRIHAVPPVTVDEVELPTLKKAKKAVEILEAAFPGAVYPQFTRMNENEEQLESFYRLWKERGNLIIQKYDWFCGRLPDRRPADLSPLDRNPCWHLLRDMIILADGSVPACREQVLSGVIGNVFDDGLENVWKRGGTSGELCKDCDEYYTFNF
ncbi:MAG: spiro-SPASM protein [Treponema sp.]|jgi:spiro-SPASM protein|nr:spiro-SPASM protein [Treponema sp.]